MNDPQPEGHMASHIERRKFLATLGGAAAWPVAARAQQLAMPVVGFLNGGPPGPLRRQVAAFHQRLKKAGDGEGPKPAVEDRIATRGNDPPHTIADRHVRRHANGPPEYIYA